MDEGGRDPDARVIYVVLVAVASPVIVAAFARDAVIDAGTTISMVLASLGIGGLVVEWRHRARVTTARVVRLDAGGLRAGTASVDRVLIVDRDLAFRRTLRAAIALAGRELVELATIAEAESALSCLSPIAIVLELDTLDDLDRLRSLRARSIVPIIAVSSRDAADDRVSAFEAGADDYILKPAVACDVGARMEELVALASARSTLGRRVIVGAIELDLERCEVMVESLIVAVTPLELRLLGCLATRAGSVCTYRQLIRSAWGIRATREPYEVRLIMSALRRKIERDPMRPRWLITEAGVGYRLGNRSHLPLPSA